MKTKLKMSSYLEERLSNIAYDFLECLDGKKLKMGDNKTANYLIDHFLRPLAEEVVGSCISQIEIGMVEESGGIFGPVNMS